MSESVLVRPFAATDLERIVAIGNAAWQDIYRMFRDTYGPELFELLTPHPESQKGEQVRRHCQQHPEWVLIVEENGHVVGFITFRLDPERRIGEIGNNAVDPAMRGRGYAQHMYRAVLERFRAEGMRFAKVLTGLDDAHAPARKAYERAGFDIHHEDISYYQKL